MNPPPSRGRNALRIVGAVILLLLGILFLLSSLCFGLLTIDPIYGSGNPPLTLTLAVVLLAVAIGLGYAGIKLAQRRRPHPEETSDPFDSPPPTV